MKNKKIVAGIAALAMLFGMGAGTASAYATDVTSDPAQTAISNTNGSTGSAEDQNVVPESVDAAKVAAQAKEENQVAGESTPNEQGGSTSSDGGNQNAQPGDDTPAQGDVSADGDQSTDEGDKTGAAPTDSKVTSEDDLAAEIAEAPTDNTATTLTFTADVALTKPVTIPAGANIVFTDDGQAHKITFAGVTSDVFTVAEGASLTLDGANLTVDGTDSSSLPGSAIFRVHGTFVLKQGTVTNATTSGSLYTKNPAGGVVAVQGAKASFDMTGGAITKNKEIFSLGSAIVFVSGGAKFNLSGGEISKNDLTSSEGSYADGEWKDPNSATFHAPVWIYPDGNSTMTMTGGAISGNTGSLAGAVMVGYPLDTASKGAAKFNFSGGEIANNIGAAYSGAVSLFSRGSAPVQFNMSGEAKITGNAGPMGGGVSTSDDYANTQPNKDKDPAKFQQWLDGYPAYQKNFEGEQFTMTGGEISGNRAVLVKDWNSGAGGGVYVASNTVKLSGGTIANNTADSQGGGIYVGTDPYVLRLMDTVVTANTASIMGGGMWLCPTGDAQSAVKNGGAIFGNTAGKADGDTPAEKDANAAGNDIASVSKKFNAKLYLSNRMLGNWLTGWYNDGGVTKYYDSDTAYDIGKPDANAKRYANMTEAEQVAAKQGGIIDSTADLALQAVAPDKGKQAANAAAKLFVTGNSAPRGGGIGTNGAVVFGEYPVEFPKISVTVTKKWEDNDNKDGKRPASVTVGLYEDKNEDGTFSADEQIDTQTLSEANKWTYTWEDLQKYAGDDPVEAAGKSLAKYEVKEAPVPDGYKAEITSAQDKDGNYTFTVTNTKTETPPPTPPTPPTGPDDGEGEFGPGAKILVGREVKAGEFTFDLKDENGKIISTVTNSAPTVCPADAPTATGKTVSCASFKFPSFSLTKEGTFTYTISERVGTEDGMTYDRTVYQVTFTVKVIGGKYVMTDHTYTAVGGSTVSDPVFTNEYEKPDEPEKPDQPDKPTEPTKPTEPSKPSKPTKPDIPKKPTLPNTGVAVASVAGAAIVLMLGGVGLRVLSDRKRDMQGPRK